VSTEPDWFFEPGQDILKFEKNVLKPSPKGLKLGRTGLKPTPEELFKLYVKCEDLDCRFSLKGRTTQHWFLL
jgi:hypothetical protein